MLALGLRHSKHYLYSLAFNGRRREEMYIQILRSALRQAKKMVMM